MNEIERRAFMKGAAIGTLAFTVGGAEVMLTPRQARAQGAALRTLTADQAATLDAMGETLVPGATEAGITHFVDQQISIQPEQALLEARIVWEFLPCRAWRDRRREFSALWRPQFCTACRQRAARVGRSDAAKQA
jgi:hypothetical protein